MKTRLPKEAPPADRRRPFRYVPLLFFITAAVAIARPFTVESHDMAPEYQNGDLVVAVPLPTWLFGPLKKGDLVALPGPLGERHIRRVVGVPGEIVEVAAGKVLVEGAPLPTEPLGHVVYSEQGKRVRFREFRELLVGGGSTVAHRGVEQEGRILPDIPGVKLGADEYYLLADRRTGVRDSRDYGAQKGEGLRRYYLPRVPGYDVLVHGIKTAN